MLIRFFGAAGTVTGSRYLLETPSHRVLVDCGLFQGYKQLRLRNWAQFPVKPRSIDAVLLTHAHLDHSGYLPALCRQGFRGAIHCSKGTAALCGILLPDSGRLQEEEAEYAERKHSSKHAKPLPLYTEAEARASLQQLRPERFGEEVRLGPDLAFTLLPAGHLLGAAQVRVRVGTTVVHFSGDLGRADDPMFPAPSPPGAADVIVCESTYGDRRHPAGDPGEALGEVVRRVSGRGGVVLIPAFAVGRTQSLLLQLYRLRQRGAIGDLPIFVNSPMANAASGIHAHFVGSHRLAEEEFRAMLAMATPVQTTQESRALNERSGPMIIISASGMLTGGRVLHHVTRFGPDLRNAIVLAGFQAGGTRGARLAAGERELKIFGRVVPIGAEVVSLDGFSAHADAEGLLGWLGSAARPPRRVYVTHGEAGAADTLRYRIENELGWFAHVPEQGETIEVPA